jgi:hypothetical protein
LTSLQLRVEGSHQGLNDVQRGFFAQVFGSSHPLEWFELHVHGHADVIVRDLLPIRSQCQLSMLNISAAYIPHDQWMLHLQTLAALVSSLPKLRHIRLTSYVFDTDPYVDSAATGALVQLVKNICNDDGQSLLDVYDSSLRESTMAQGLLDCLVGSPIQTLRCGGCRTSYFSDFFEGMIAKQSEISLPCLELSCFLNSHVDALVRFIPILTRLRSLKLPPHGGEHTNRLVDAVRRNGSLGYVAFGDVPLDDPALERNACLPKLLANPCTAADGTAKLVLFPTLFYAACQAPRMAPNTILIGLLAPSSDSFGPHRASFTKRAKLQEWLPKLLTLGFSHLVAIVLGLIIGLHIRS